MNGLKASCYVCAAFHWDITATDIGALFPTRYRNMTVLACERHFIEYGPPEETKLAEPEPVPLMGRPYKPRPHA